MTPIDLILLAKPADRADPAAQHLLLESKMLNKQLIASTAVDVVADSCIESQQTFCERARVRRGRTSDQDAAIIRQPAHPKPRKDAGRPAVQALNPGLFAHRRGR